MKLVQYFTFKVISIFFLLFSQSTFAGGGYVGNGGGLVEQNFNFIYGSLSRIISDSMSLNGNQFLKKDLTLLQKIRSISQDNQNKNDRLIFLSGRENEHIFNLGPNEPHRLAVTELKAGAPIYINTDLLYNQFGEATVLKEEMVGILVHELGHQALEKNHQYLDILGGKIRKTYLSKTVNHSIKRELFTFNFIITNYSSDFNSSSFSFENNKASINLTSFIVSSLKSIQKMKNYYGLSGYELVNGNYKLEFFPDRIVFEVWVSASFKPSANNSNLKSELFPLAFEIDHQGNLL